LNTQRSLAGALIHLGRVLVYTATSGPSTKEGIAEMSTLIQDNVPQAPSMLDRALTAFQEALQLIDPAVQPGLYGVVLHDIADAHKVKGDLQKAAESYRNSVSHKLRADNPGDLTTTLLVFGDFLIDCDELVEARAILDQARQVLTAEVGNEEGRALRAARIHNLGQSYERLGNQDQEGAYAEAMSAYKQALELVDADSDPSSYGTVLCDIGDVHAAEGRPLEAAALYEDGIKYLTRANVSSRALARVKIDLGRIYLRVAKLEREGSIENEKDPRATHLTEPEVPAADTALQ